MGTWIEHGLSPPPTNDDDRAEWQAAVMMVLLDKMDDLTSRSLRHDRADASIQGKWSNVQSYLKGLLAVLVAAFFLSGFISNLTNALRNTREARQPAEQVVVVQPVPPAKPATPSK